MTESEWKDGIAGQLLMSTQISLAIGRSFVDRVAFERALNDIEGSVETTERLMVAISKRRVDHQEKHMAKSAPHQHCIFCVEEVKRTLAEGKPA